MTSLEICVESLESAIAAKQGGAQRVELCSALSVGGLTPSLGLIRAVRSRLRIGVNVMIRPRAGDFLYSADEIDIMRQDIRLAAEAGADGVVLGLLTAESDVDVQGTWELVELASPMEVTFHRAFDMTRNIHAALEDVIQTGAVRVLTSGGEATAMSGSGCIHELLLAARGRIELMVGGGVKPENVAAIADAIIEPHGRSRYKLAFHASLNRPLLTPLGHQAPRIHLGDAGFVVRAEDARALREALDWAETSATRSPG